MYRQLILIFMAVTLVQSAPLQLGGYAENHTSLSFDSNGTISDAASARLEAEWEYGRRGGVEVHGIISAAMTPLDIFASFRDGSVMQRAAEELMAPLTAAGAEFDSAMKYMDSAVVVHLANALAPLADDERGTGRFLHHLPYSSFYPRDKFTLDRAVVKSYFSFMDLYIGRQMIGWGTGYGFNPTDVWNVKNPIDPSAPKIGVNAIRAEIPFGPLTGLSLVLSPGPDVDATSAGGRFKSTLGSFDASLSAIRYYTADAALLGRPRKMIVGADCAGQIIEAGVWFEAAAVNPFEKGGPYDNFDNAYAQIDAGLDYTFENGLYLLGEYYYNGLGKKSREDYNGMDLLNLMSGAMSGLGQHYLMAGGNKNFIRHTTTSLFILTNLTDLSLMVMPAVEYVVHDNILLEVEARIAVGDRRESEYGSLYHGVNCTVQGYF